MFKLFIVFAILYLLLLVVAIYYKSKKAKELAKIKLKNAQAEAEARNLAIQRQNLITMYKLQNCAIRLRIMQMLKRVDPAARKHCRDLLMVAMLQYNFPRLYSKTALDNIDIAKLKRTLRRHEAFLDALNKLMLETPTDGTLTVQIIYSVKGDMNYSRYLKTCHPDPLHVRIVQSYIDKIFYKIPENAPGLDDYEDISRIL